MNSLTVCVCKRPLVTVTGKYSFSCQWKCLIIPQSFPVEKSQRRQKMSLI